MVGETSGTESIGEVSPLGVESVGKWAPDPESPQFTLAVMPDTQFLYFAPSIRPEPQLASFRYIVDRANGGSDNIVFMSHLGDLTEDGLATEFGPVGDVFDYLDERNVGARVPVQQRQRDGADPGAEVECSPYAPSRAREIRE